MVPVSRRVNKVENDDAGADGGAVAAPESALPKSPKRGKRTTTTRRAACSDRSAVQRRFFTASRRKMPTISTCGEKLN